MHARHVASSPDAIGVELVTCHAAIIRPGTELGVFAFRECLVIAV
jgi:hypothetical protein